MALAKKVIKTCVKICLAFVLLLILLLILCFIYNLVCSRHDTEEIAAYGKGVSVNGHTMNVVIEGDGDETIVLLPGFGTAAPALDFKSLAEELKTDYRVVMVEPFGYGLSDVTEEARTIEAMNEELHMCLKELGIETYILAGHSIAGIYGLRYIQEYREEVKGYVGLDTSVPYQIHQGDLPTWIYPILKTSGIYRALMKLSPKIFEIQGLNQEENQVLARIALKNLGNKNILSEGEQFIKNLEKVQKLRYPDDLPVIFFLASQSADAHDFWIREHENMIENVAHGELVILDGPHYIHHGHEAEIRQKLHDFLKLTDNEK